MLARDSGSSGFSGIGAAIGKAAGSAAKKVAKRGTSSGRASSRSSRSSSGSSGRSSGYSSRSSSRSSRSSGGGGGGYVPRSAAPKPPTPPSLASYLGMDSVYQQSVRGGKRSLTDFLSEIQRRRGEAGTQFNQTKASMERDRTQQLESLRDEFASRGLIQSGLYGEEQGRFQKQFTEQGNALAQQQAALLADLLGQEKNYRRESDLALEQAKQEAIARRAAKYKIG
jgi:hypothetical protein